MARPERRNADYFPFYAKDGRTLFLLESKYKCKGTGFFTNVMRFLTLETDHHVNILDETDRLYFFSKCHCDEESGMDMLGIMSKTGKIDKDLWEIRIVASQALLDSLSDAYRNRKNTIITMEEIRQIYISDVRNEVNDVGNEVNSVNNTQTKLKKTKVNKRVFIKPFLGDFQNVKLTEEELSKLEKKFTDAMKRIENLSCYIQSKGDKYKDHYATILNWARMEKNDPGSEYI